MNLTAVERKIWNKIKHLQIPESEITPVNFGAASFYAGAEYMCKLIMNLRNGDLTEQQVDIELAKLIPMETVN